MVHFSVILPAGGSGSRFGGNKLIADLAGQPVIVWSINAFLQRADVTQVIIATACKADLIAEIEKLSHSELILSSRKLVWAEGGETRAKTVKNALPHCTSDYVAIHDAARPLVSQELIDQTFAATVAHGAAAPGTPVTLTVKEAQSKLPAQIVRTIPRQNLFAMQTPQCMKIADLKAGIENCPIPLEQVTDDLQLLELIQKPAYIVTGEDRNLKITTPIDLRIAHEWLQSD